MQGEARLEAVDRLQLVAVENGYVMVAASDDDDEEIERIGLEHRLVRQGLRSQDDARGRDLLPRPRPASA